VASEVESLVFSTMKCIILLSSFLALQHCHAKQVDVCYVCLEWKLYLNRKVCCTYDLQDVENWQWR